MVCDQVSGFGKPKVTEWYSLSQDLRLVTQESTVLKDSNLFDERCTEFQARMEKYHKLTRDLGEYDTRKSLAL